MKTTCQTLVETYRDLQDLLGEHIIPVQETDNLVAVSVDNIISRVACLVGSSCLFLSRFPDIIESD